MKGRFLLTSAGITNASIGVALLELVGKPASEVNALFIPTAANVVEGDKGWLIENLEQMKKANFKKLDVLDIADVPKAVWEPRMVAADVICFGGGNEQYLAKVLRDSGVTLVLPKLLEGRVYMGISAGSMVAGKFLSYEMTKVIFPEEVSEPLADPLAFIDCLFIPHLNSSYFSQIRKEVLEKNREHFDYPLYACDDNSALKIVDGRIGVVSEGEVVAIK